MVVPSFSRCQACGHSGNRTQDYLRSASEAGVLNANLWNSRSAKKNESEICLSTRSGEVMGSGFEERGNRKLR